MKVVKMLLNAEHQYIVAEALLNSANVTQDRVDRQQTGSSTNWVKKGIMRGQNANRVEYLLRGNQMSASGRRVRQSNSETLPGD